MKRTMMRTVLVVLSLAGIAAAAQSKGDASLAAARKGIDKSNAAYSRAVEKHDAAAIRDLYTTDAKVFVPDQAVIEGNAAVEEFIKGSFSAGMTGLDLETADVERSGELAVETGKYTMTVTPPGKDAQSSSGKYVVVWKHQKDGSWKLHRDIWNNGPASK